MTDTKWANPWADGIELDDDPLKYSNPSKGPGLKITRGVSYPATVITANKTLDGTQHFCTVDPTGGTFAVTLPAAASFPGRLYRFIRIVAGANGVTIVPPAGTINGAANVSLPNQYDVATIWSDGINWYKVG